LSARDFFCCRLYGGRTVFLRVAASFDCARLRALFPDAACRVRHCRMTGKPQSPTAAGAGRHRSLPEKARAGPRTQ